MSAPSLDVAARPLDTSAPPGTPSRRLPRAMLVGTLACIFAWQASAIPLAVLFWSRPYVPPQVLSNVVGLPASLLFPILGYLIATRRPAPERRIGYVLLTIALLEGVSQVGDLYGSLSWQVLAHPLPLAREVVWLPYALPDLAGFMTTALLLMVPEGVFGGPVRRFIALAIGIAGVGYVISLTFGETPYFFVLGQWTTVPKTFMTFHGVVGPVEEMHRVLRLSARYIFAFPLLLLAARIPRASLIRRRQLVVLLVGATVAYLYLYVDKPCSWLGFGTDPNTDWCIPVSVNVGRVALPVAIAVAVFRYRLWPLDVVINKGVVYAGLAAFIGLAYVGVVVGIGTLVGTGGHPNVWLSIFATTLVAVGFQSARDRLQRAANRLVFGERATPYEAMSEFSKRMQGVLSIDEVLPRIAEAAANGLGARAARVRLALPSGDARSATWPADERMVDPDTTVPVEHKGEVLGDIAVAAVPGDTITPAQRGLLEDLASQAGLALRNVRLTEELRASRERIVAAQDEERRKIERNLHDGAQQRLITLSLELRMMRERLAQGADPWLVSKAERIHTEAAAALDDLREQAQGLHPAILTDEGLEAALEYLAERAPLPVRVQAGAERYAAPVEATAYYVVSEALANVAKYAEATEVSVSVARSNGTLLVEVVDDGVGGADPRGGSGLRGLADRVAALSGVLRVESPSGEGTRVSAEIPCG
ncbi:MAG: GAF domain-containing sensor histidine kinase [Actinomycetota bacterium]